jgi:hypothetical protein
MLQVCGTCALEALLARFLSSEGCFLHHLLAVEVSSLHGLKQQRASG